jgi:EmrB/QacA subfamily drug resistance transporter
VEGSRQHYGFTLAILTLAGTAFAIQQTMVFPALTTFQREFATSTAWVTWVLTGFLVAAAVTTPILGRLGDQFGKERMLVISLGLFFVGSAAAAAAWNIWSLIGFRMLAGAGGALFPLSFAIIRDEFPRERAQMGYGLLSAVFGVGGGIGIVASGVIVDHFSWRWLFVLGSIPVLLSLLLVYRFIPESPIKSPSRVDVPGALLLSASLVALMLALTQGEPWGWTSAPILGLALASAASFLAWLRVERRVESPMVDLNMLAHRPVLLTNIVTLIAGFALFSCFVLVPTFVQSPESRGYGFGASATDVGLYLLPGSAALLFAGPLAGLMGRRFGAKWPLSLGMLLIAFAALGLAFVHDEPWQVIVSYTVLCTGVGLAFAAMVTLIAENVDETETGVATGMNTVIRLIGAVVGGQIGAALLTAYTVRSGAPAEAGYTIAFTLSAVAGAAAALIALSIAPRTARERLEPAQALD